MYLARRMCPYKGGQAGTPRPPGIHQTELFLSNGQIFLLPHATTVKVISQNDQIRY